MKAGGGKLETGKGSPLKKGRALSAFIGVYL